MSLVQGSKTAAVALKRKTDSLSRVVLSRRWRETFKNW